MDVLVSVYCLAYNHEKYIRETLKGFINQKTNFAFEVIIHDDASTDKTASIINEYVEKYPNIFKPIYQTENQYSKNISIFQTYILPLVKGKYIAVCEGDDYWCNADKLQSQVDWLEKHPEYSLCVHNTKQINCVDGKERLISAIEEDCDIPIEEIIKWKGGLFHTSSIMYRKEFAVIPPDFFVKGIGDYPKALYLATCGRVRYIAKVMSVYRYLSSNSWSMRMYHSDDSTQKLICHWQDRINMLKKVNRYTNRKYEDCISNVIRQNEFNIVLRQNQLKKCQKEYAELYNKLEFKDKVRAYINFYAPCLLRFYRRIRKE